MKEFTKKDLQQYMGVVTRDGEEYIVFNHYERGADPIAYAADRNKTTVLDFSNYNDDLTVIDDTNYSMPFDHPLDIMFVYSRSFNRLDTLFSDWFESDLGKRTLYWKRDETIPKLTYQQLKEMVGHDFILTEE